MRILREGRMELVERSQKFECDNCKCVFIADKNDIDIMAINAKATYGSVTVHSAEKW